MKIFNQDLYQSQGLQEPRKRLARYRGLLFENMIESLVKHRFDLALFSTGCRIHVDKTHLIYHYGEGNASHKETIDIAGWIDDKEYGEFYECKVHPDKFEAQHYCFLNMIIDMLKEHKIDNYVVGFVSAMNTSYAKSVKKHIEGLNDDCSSDFRVIGVDDIYKMKTYTVPTA